jgi:hypothetical protein
MWTSAIWQLTLPLYLSPFPLLHRPQELGKSKSRRSLATVPAGKTKHIKKIKLTFLKNKLLLFVNLFVNLCGNILKPKTLIKR